MPAAALILKLACIMFLREYDDSVLTLDTKQVLFLRTIRYSYKYACNDCRETTIDLEHIILNYIITMEYFLLILILPDTSVS